MENKRNYFRVDMYGEELHITTNGKEKTEQIRDVSGNGISFQSTDHWEIGDLLTFRFSISKKEFIFQGKIARIADGTMGRIVYGCQFINQKEKEKSELSSLLLRIEATRRKK